MDASLASALPLDRLTELVSAAGPQFPPGTFDPPRRYIPKPKPKSVPAPADSKAQVQTSQGLRETTRFTAAELLTQAARELPQPFAAETLIVEAWKRWPETFGLRGYDHPDSNKVITYLVGARGLVARGRLDQVGPKMYRVGEA